jgi:hypothetical protein
MSFYPPVTGSITPNIGGSITPVSDNWNQRELIVQNIVTFLCIAQLVALSVSLTLLIVQTPVLELKSGLLLLDLGNGFAQQDAVRLGVRFPLIEPLIDHWSQV